MRSKNIAGCAIAPGTTRKLWCAHLVVLLAVLLPTIAFAQTCRQALALGLDVSGSVDTAEYRLQLHGLAAALDDGEVRNALLSFPGAPVHLAVYEWSASTYQRIIVPWVIVVSDQTLDDAASRLRRWQRSDAPQTTGLGASLEFGAFLLNERRECARRTLDISGDGKNNIWPRPVMIKGNGTLDGITVNALVIGQERLTQPDGGEAGDIAELTAYFRQRIIHGPDAFIEVALGFQDYAQAMKRKLLKELQTFAIGTNFP